MPSRAGARPSGLMPTRRRLGPFASSSWMRVRAREAALAAAALLHRPHEVGLDRARRLVDVVAVEAEAGLEAQRVARAEPDRLHARPAASSSCGELPAPCRRQPRSRSRPRRCSPSARCGSRTPPMRPLDADMKVKPAATSDSFASTVLAAGPCRAMSARSGAGSRMHAGGQARGDVGVVHLLARGVDDQEQPAVVLLGGRARHHQVVDDAAGIVQQLGVALLARLQVQDVGRHQGFQRGGGGRVAGPDQEGLPHVRDVEQARAARACAGAPSGCPADTARASRSPRTAPSWRPAPRAGRRAACVSEAGRKPGHRSSHPKSHRACVPHRPARVQAPSVTGPERFRRDLPPYPFGEPALRRLLSRVPSTCGPFA